MSSRHRDSILIMRGHIIDIRIEVTNIIFLVSDESNSFWEILERVL